MPWQLDLLLSPSAIAVLATQKSSVLSVLLKRAAAAKMERMMRATPITVRLENEGISFILLIEFMGK